jgi:hypothetical protein
VRALWLACACTGALGLLFIPAMRGGALTPAAHGLLTPLLLCLCGCFARGLGYRPASRWTRWLLSAWVLGPATVLAGGGFVLAYVAAR